MYLTNVLHTRQSNGSEQVHSQVDLYKRGFKITFHTWNITELIEFIQKLQHKHAESFSHAGKL